MILTFSLLRFKENKMIIIAEPARERKDNGPDASVRKEGIVFAMNFQNTMLKILAVAVCMFLGALGSAKITDAATTNKITQSVFTFFFDKQYTYGQFANGDYWVVGPVTITRITPDFDGKNYGWEVNPTIYDRTGLQDRCASGNLAIDPSKVPALPYTAQPNQSIVKASPSGVNLPCIKSAAVLTVVGSPPPGNGADILRPPYVGSEKPYYYVSQMRTGLLPSFAPVANMHTLEWVEKRFRPVWLDHAKPGNLRRAMHPDDHMYDYGADVAMEFGDGLLRLMMNDSLQDKMPALINY